MRMSKQKNRSQNGKHTCINTHLKTFTTPNLLQNSLSILKKQQQKTTTLFVLSTRSLIPYPHVVYLNVYFYLLCTYFKEIKIKNKDLTSLMSIL